MEQIVQLDNADEILILPNSWEERGIRKGLEIGIEQGNELATRELAIELLRENASVELVAKVTHFSIEEVEKIKRSL